MPSTRRHGRYVLPTLRRLLPVLLFPSRRAVRRGWRSQPCRPLVLPVTPLPRRGAGPSHLLRLPNQILLTLLLYYPAPIWRWVNQRFRSLFVDEPLPTTLFRCLSLHTLEYRDRTAHETSLGQTMSAIQHGHVVWHLAFLQPRYLHPSGWMPLCVACDAVKASTELRSLFLFLYRAQMKPPSSLSGLARALQRKPLLHTVVLNVFHRSFTSIEDFRPLVHALRLLPRLRYLELDLSGNLLGSDVGPGRHRRTTRRRPVSGSSSGPCACVRRWRSCSSVSPTAVCRTLK